MIPLLQLLRFPAPVCILGNVPSSMLGAFDNSIQFHRCLVNSICFQCFHVVFSGPWIIYDFWTIQVRAFYKPRILVQGILQTKTGSISVVSPVILVCFPRISPRWFFCVFPVYPRERMLGNVPSPNHLLFTKCRNRKSDTLEEMAWTTLTTCTRSRFYKMNRPASPFYQDWHCHSDIFVQFGAKLL